MQDLGPNVASQLPPLSPAMAASVFVKNLTYSTTWWEVQVASQPPNPNPQPQTTKQKLETTNDKPLSAIQAHFAEAGDNHVHLFTGPDGKSKGCASVTFATSVEAQAPNTQT